MIKRILTGLLLISIAFASFAASYSRYVSVQSLAIKEKASNRSKTVASISYGDEVTVSKTSGKWSLVSPKSSPSVKGWVSTSALSKRKIVKGKTVTTDASEISLAGKGFSEGLEAEYSKNGTADYAAVDLIEQNQIPESDQQAFISEGKLKEASE